MAGRNFRVVKQIPESNRGKYERKPDKVQMKMVKAMQSHPYEWVQVRVYSNTASASRFASKIRTSEPIAFKGAKYEAKSVRGVVYARYMGDEVSPAKH